MKRIILILLLCVLWSHSFASPSSASTVHVEVKYSQDMHQAGGSYPVLICLDIKDSWYIHGTVDEGEGLIPTVLLFNNTPSIDVESIKFPEPERKHFDYTDEAIEVFSGQVRVKAMLRVKKNAPLGKHVIKGKLSYQACSNKVCLPPEKIPVPIELDVVPDGTPVKAMNQEEFRYFEEQRQAPHLFPVAQSETGFWLSLLFIFLGGLALNLTPCIYPLIPITVSYFGGKSEKVFGNSILHGILYLTGLAVTNSVLGVSSALSGGMFGSALQNPAVLIFVACVMIALGLSFFGFWEIRLPGILTTIASRSYKGYFGTFFMGLTLGIVAAPCVGPFILGLFTYVGQRGDPFLGFIYFFVLSIGMGLPLCVLAVFSGAIEKLPMSGDWMVWIRKLMGWVLFGMAAYFIGPLFTNPDVKPIIITIVIIVGGLHLGWLDKTGRGLRQFSMIKKVAGTLIMAVGLVFFIPTLHEREGIQWTPFHDDLLQEARKNERPVIFDLSANWCKPCEELEERVFRDPEVVDLSKQFVTLRMDLTRENPLQDEILHRYNVIGVPAVLFFNDKGIEERKLRVESLVSRDEFLRRMKELLELDSTQ